MAENSITIDGTSYISSSRAASLFGYTKDYVGQLARSGKIKSQLIGRTWYIDEDSIRSHKLNVHYTLTKPKKPRRKENTGNVDTAEIPIRNIDISEREEGVPIHELIKRFDTKPKQTMSRAETSMHDTEEQELFPTLKKKSTRDPFTQTDFVYEPNHPVEYVEKKANFDNRAQSIDIFLHAKPATTDGIRVIRSRDTKEIVKTSNKIPPTRSVSGPMDGIIVEDRTRRGSATNDDTGLEKSRTHLNDDESFEDVSEDEVLDKADKLETRPSRLLPILGAVVLFFIFTTLYLLS